MWNQELRLPVFVPTLSDRIMIKVMDWERVGDNNEVATMYFRWNSIL